MKLYTPSRDSTTIVGFVALIMMALVLTIVSCSDDEIPLKITSMAPTNGSAGTTVVITGSGFSPIAAHNRVTLNSTACSVFSATETELIFTITAGAGSGEIKVEVGSNFATTPAFEYELTTWVNTFAGTGTLGSAIGAGSIAQFNLPKGVAMDASGNMYVADFGNNRICKITTSGVVSTLAGSVNGSDDGPGVSAQFNLPTGVAVDASGNVYVTDWANHRIRKITPTGVVTTLAGSTEGYADDTGALAKFNIPYDVVVNASGNAYVTDAGNYRIRKITPAGEVTTLAGSTLGTADGDGALAQFAFPQGVAIDDSGNMYVADAHRIRKITPAGVVSTLAGSTEGFADGNGVLAQFNSPKGVAVDASDNVYVADWGNNRIRKITPAGMVTTLAGSTEGFADNNNELAKFNHPTGIVVNESGTVFYVTDANNHRIRQILIH